MAAVLGVTKQTAWRLVQSGEIRARLVAGQLWVAKKSVVVAYARKRQRAAEAAAAARPLEGLAAAREATGNVKRHLAASMAAVKKGIFG